MLGLMWRNRVAHSVIIDARKKVLEQRSQGWNSVRTGPKKGGAGGVNIGAIGLENSLSLKWHLGEGWYTVKKGYRFSRPRSGLLTKLSLAGNN